MNLSGTVTSQLSDRPERGKDTFLTAGIFFSLDRCLLMGDPAFALLYLDIDLLSKSLHFYLNEIDVIDI
jgi:hypothetical protein